MKKNSLFIFLFTIILSCKSKSETTSTDSLKPPTDSVATASKPVEKMCFLFAENKDSTKVSLTIEGDVVTGEMDWLPNEKDGAIGTLKGKKVGDVITADYSFVIEGSNEIEEKIFVLQGDKLIEKVGELEFKNGKSIMKNPEKAENGDILTKVVCEF